MAAEKMDLLVKEIPVQLHSIFKGFCAMQNVTVNDGMIEAMAVFIEKVGGGKNQAVDQIMAKLRPGGKRK